MSVQRSRSDPPPGLSANTRVTHTHTHTQSLQKKKQTESVHSPVSIQISPMIQRQLLVVILWTFLMLKGLWNFSGGLLGIQLYLLGWHYLMPWAHSLGINTHIHPYTQFTSVRQDEFAGQSQRSDGVLTDESCETSWQWNRKILQIRHFTNSSTVHIGSHDAANLLYDE